MDRLHYMTDACVKYDSEKKLWIYLHSDRNYEHPGWGEDGEDYLDKYPSKKKKRDFEWISLLILNYRQTIYLD